jgi:hypothetical protein
MSKQASHFKTAVFTGAPFGVVIAAFLFWLVGADGVLPGLASGVAFGGLMSTFVAAQAKRMAIADSFEGEPVIIQGPANHFAKGEGRGGWLTLTPTKLAFRSHGKNLQNHPVDIPLVHIVSIRPARTLGIVPNGLHVTTADGCIERFVVQNRQTWADRIRAVVQSD